ncbi:hypothetical protein SD208_18890 [Ochrobactrum sp. BD67]
MMYAIITVSPKSHFNGEYQDAKTTPAFSHWNGYRFMSELVAGAHNTRFLRLIERRCHYLPWP